MLMYNVIVNCFRVKKKIAMYEYLNLLMQDYTLQTITVGTAILGAICGVLGCFAVLRKQSLLGDAISHASLPGIAIMFLVLGVKNNNGLLLGALLSGLVAALFIRGIIQKTHLKSDTALGVVLSTFFGFGMLLLTFIQKQSNANQSGLEKYLFGQAATLMIGDVYLMIIVTFIALLVVMLFWKEFKMFLFDSDYTKSLGYHVKVLDIMILVFIVLAIIMGLQMLPLDRARFGLFLPRIFTQTKNVVKQRWLH